MKNKIWIWAAILLLVAASLPGLAERWQTEVKNNTYETVVPYEEIFGLTTEATITVEEALSSLKEAGLTSVSFSPITIKEMEEVQNTISVFNEQQLADELLFVENKDGFDPEKDGFYITIPEVEYYDELIKENFNPELITIGDMSFYFISADSDVDLSAPLGYDEVGIELAKQFGLNVILRVENTNETSNQRMIDTLLELKDEQVTNVLFSGDEAIGYSPDNVAQLTEWSNELSEAGYSFYTIEFTPIKGMQTIARTTDFNIIRLHSITWGDKTIEEYVEQAVRAAKERNMRSIFFHIQTSEPEEGLATAVEFLEGVNAQMPANLTSGSPAPFEQMDLPIWTLIASLGAGILFTYAVSSLVENKILRILAVVFMALLAAGYLVLERLVLLQGFALLIAVMTPIYAVLSTSKESDGRLSTIALQYLKASGISAIGIAIMVGLLNGNAFINGIEVFRGVILVYVVPIAFVTIYLFWNIILESVHKYGIKVLRFPVVYWHVLLFVIIAGIGYYYIIRTGNTGSASAIELAVRAKLEELLYVRPRTKEFLIGFPLFVLALYVLSKSKVWGKLLLIPGTIGFLSIVNTFSHLHIPLFISVLRTVYSLVLGFIIGLILIYLFKLAMNLWTKFVNKQKEKDALSR